MRRYIRLHLVHITLILMAALGCAAQETQPPARAQSSAPASAPGASGEEGQEPVKVFTEEVRIPVAAYNEDGRFDPTLEADDVLVLEDGVAQQIRSIRRLPASVLLLLDVGALDAQGKLDLAKDAAKTQRIARELIERLRADDKISVWQFSDDVRLLQDWTTSKETAAHALETRLTPGRQTRLTGALVAAAEKLSREPAGNRHLVLITSGEETPDAKLDLAGAVKRMSAAHITVHVIRDVVGARRTAERARQKAQPRRRTSGMPTEATAGIDPTLPPGTYRGVAASGPNGIPIQIRLPARRRKGYEEATRRIEGQLKTLAEETGGRMWLLESSDDAAKQGALAAEDVTSRYVVTYVPKRPLSRSGEKNEYRQVRVLARRNNLQLHARRGYLAQSAN